MENEEIETFLQSLRLEKYLDLFKKNMLDYNTLIDLTQDEMDKYLSEIGLPTGIKIKIIKGIKAKKVTALESLPNENDPSDETFKNTVNASKILPNESDSSDETLEKALNVKEETITHEEIRLVILGKTGSGKSATGNSILGKDYFTSTISGISITRKCEQSSAIRFNRKFTIVDTPGIFDTSETNEAIQNEIYRCIGITSPGPHAFILVLPLSSRYTPEEQSSIDHFVKYFGENMYNYIVVLFTRKDELDAHKKTLKDHLENNCPPNLKLFIKSCGGRTIAFDNNVTDEKQEKQVKELLDIVLKNVENNNGKYYTNEMYERAEEEIKKREKERIENERKKREEEHNEIKMKCTEDFNKKLAEEKKKAEIFQLKLNELLKNQQKLESRNNLMESTIKDYEKKMVESSGKQQEEAKIELESARRERDENRQERQQLIEVIKDYQKKIDKSNEDQDKMKDDHKTDKEDLAKNLAKQMEEQNKKTIETVRTEVREEIVKSLGFFARNCSIM